MFVRLLNWLKQVDSGRKSISQKFTAIDGLHPSVVACAETQERLCWTCDPSLTQMILDHYNKEWDLPGVSVGARASLVGKVKKEITF